MDLLHQTGASVNDGIKPELCMLKCTSVDEVYSETNFVAGSGNRTCQTGHRKCIQSGASAPNRQTSVGDGMQKELSHTLTQPYLLT